MKKILLHLSTNSKIYVGICKMLSQYVDNKIYTANLHDSLYDSAAETDPDIIVLPLHEYTAEFHSFINNTSKKIILIIDNTTQAENILHIANSITKKHNVMYISPIDIPTTSTTIKYTGLYDSDTFNDKNISVQIQKTAVILHSDNNVNQQLIPALYPHSSDVVCFNNQKFNHPTNLGLLSFKELAEIFNTYEYILDMTDLFKLEIMACKGQYISKDGDLTNNIKNKITISKVPDLEQYSFNSFVINNDKIKEFLGV